MGHKYVPQEERHAGLEAGGHHLHTIHSRWRRLRWIGARDSYMTPEIAFGPAARNGLRLLHRSVGIDGKLEARARRTGAAPPLHLFAVEVRDEGQTILRGEIGVYVESDSATGA